MKNFSANFKRSRGRISLELAAFAVGESVQAIIYGGRAHIGAIALASPGSETQIRALPGHYDGEIAGPISQFLADALGRDVAVSAGIHYDAISQVEIEAARELAALLAQDLCRELKKGHSC